MLLTGKETVRSLNLDKCKVPSSYMTFNTNLNQSICDITPYYDEIMKWIAKDIMPWMKIFGNGNIFLLFYEMFSLISWARKIEIL